MSDPDGVGTPPPAPADLGPTPTTGSPAAPDSAPALPEPIPHAGARYAALRLLMLAAVGGILYLVGMRGWLLAFAAVLVSGIVSLFLFIKQRNDAAVNLERSLEHWKQRHGHEDDDTGEDEDELPRA
jgi:hypothetical protein